MPEYSAVSYPSSVTVPAMAPLQANSFTSLGVVDQQDVIRIQRYRQNLLFYIGQQWAQPSTDGETRVMMNYVRKFIDKGAEFLTGAGFTVKVPDPLEHVTRPLLDEVWEYNGKNSYALNTATDGGIKGDSFHLITWEEPSANEKRMNPFSQGRIRVSLIGAERVFVEWDPLNSQRMLSARIETLYYMDTAQLGIAAFGEPAQSPGGTIGRFTQIVRPDLIIEQYHGKPPVVRANPLGEIPLVHIKNLPFPGDSYGFSDAQDLIDLQRSMNEKSTDVSDVIAYHASPSLIFYGVKTKQLEANANRVWSGLPVNAKVEYLQFQGDMPASMAFIKATKTAMHELSDVPEGALGQQQAISNTSGIALHIQYQPLLGKTARKKTQYEPGFERINYFILRIAAVQGLVKLPFDICKHCGGRILSIETGLMTKVWDPDQHRYVDVPQTMLKCYHIDKHTLEFKDPMDMRLKIWRMYGFGRELKEQALKDILQTIEAEQPSFWDYTVVQDALRQRYQVMQDAQNMVSAARDAQAAGLPPPPPPSPPPVAIPKSLLVTQLPDSEMEVPEEPERISLATQWVNPETGEIAETTVEERYLVPTGCKTPQYLNPYKSLVEFNDVLPKDEALDAELLAVYQKNNWVDEEFCRQQIARIRPEAAAIARRMRMRKALEERLTPTTVTDVTSGATTVYGPGQSTGSGGSLAPGGAAGEQLGMVPGADGNPTPVTNQLPSQMRGA